MIRYAPQAYEITVRGLLDAVWFEWFDVLALTHTQNATTFKVRVADQPALHGIIARIRDLNLSLVMLREIQSH